MDLTVKGKDLTLNFGVRFVAELDRTKVIDGGHGITFGIGTVIAQEQLNMGSYEALVNVIRCALHDHNLTLDEVYATLDEQEDLDGLFEKIEGELKNSVAVQVAKKRMEKMKKEENRKQAAKRTSK